jgi:hypothetical protein
MQFEFGLHALCDAGVEFVVIGGLSGTFHGSTRATLDIDICYSRSTPNLKCLVAALAPFHPRPQGFPVELPFVWDETTLRNSPILTLHTDVGEIDLLAEIAGFGSYDEVKAHSIVVDAFERKMATLDLPSLIRAKRAAGREKDLAALPELESLLEISEP